MGPQIVYENGHAANGPKRNPSRFYPGKIIDDSLIKAAKIGDNAEILRFLKTRIDINATDACDKAALHYAAENGKIRTCVLLMENGADMHILDACNRTALHWAANGGNTRICAFLIAKGVDADAVGSDDSSALGYAIRSKNAGTIKFLDFFRKLDTFIGKETMQSFLAPFGLCISAQPMAKT